MTLASFAAIWHHPANQFVKVEAEALESAQAALGFKFPDDYIAQVLDTGLPQGGFPVEAYEALDAQEVETFLVDSFFTPEEIVRLTRDYWSAGMPAEVVGFAYDNGGNMFCFHQTEPGVWIFDHDYITVTQLAPTFSAWTDEQAKFEISRN